MNLGLGQKPTCRRLFCTLLLTGFGTAPLPAAEPTYYDCTYPPGTDSAGSALAQPLVLRFMLNTRQKRAFRIDTPVARLVEISVSATNDITLMDCQESREVSMVTIRNNGDSVFSRHMLSGQTGEPDRESPIAPIGSQFFGKCFPVHQTAMRSP